MKFLQKSSAKTHFFFTRMLLFSTLLLAIFTIVSSCVIGYLSYQNEKSQLTKYYDIAGVSLMDACDYHYSYFQTLAGKLLSNNRCNPALMDLMEADSIDEMDSLSRTKCSALLHDICNDEKHLRGFILYSELSDNLYYYMDTRAYLSYAGKYANTFGFIPYSGNIVSTDTIDRLLLLCGIEEYGKYYGMTATLFKTPGDTVGFVIPLYSTSEYTNILNNLSIDSNSVYMINDVNGAEIYNSIYSQPVPESGYYVSKMDSTRYHYTVTYFIPKIKALGSYTTYLLILITLLITLFSFALLFVTYYLSSKNIAQILDGMSKFNIERLDYRIPRPNANNEFTMIIDSFNQMCSELQNNVEKSYIYELQQKKSELYALQTSINPHFLYNSMEIIRSQIQVGNKDDASQMILLLSKIYRAQTNTNMFSTIDQETELCNNLMELYQYRFPNFEYEFDCPDNISQFALPRNSLQPLIENYFVHGIDKSREDNYICLSTSPLHKEDKFYIRLTLSNNGNTLSKEDAEKLNQKIKNDVFTSETAGFALTNIYSRMRIVFHDDCSLKVSSGSEDMNFEIELIFPAMSITELQKQFS